MLIGDSDSLRRKALQRESQFFTVTGSWRREEKRQQVCPTSASENRVEASVPHRPRLHRLLHVVFPLLLCQRFAGLLALAWTARRLRSGSTQPREDWITPSIGVSCQMVSCTCCLKQGGPAAATTATATARPTLEHIISASKMIMLFTHAHTHNR